MSISRPVRLFFIRHGQTENFGDPPFNGWRDAPLTEFGRRQLDQTAEALAGVPFAAVYASDLSRAVYGGSRLAEKQGLTLVSGPQWREMSFGRWEGRTYAQIAAEDQELIRRLFARDGSGADLPFPGGGESSADFRRRIEKALAALLAAHPQGGRVALVAHGGVCKMLWSLILNLSPAAAWAIIQQDFAAVNVADLYPGGLRIAHLVNGYLGPEGYYKTGLGFERLLGESVFK